jgi:ferrochelatase
VLPFLENVTRGRGVPPERLREVAVQYELFGGRSPINDQNRALMAAVTEELTRRGHDLPGAWGNRNWEPYLLDGLRELSAVGRRRTVCVVTSAFSSYSGCRQYLDDIDRALGELADPPEITRVRVFWNHPEFLGTIADRVTEARSAAGLPPDTHVVFTAHSIPVAQAATCDYVAQLTEAVSLVTDLAALTGTTELCFQSRSGPPQVPWLEPDIGDRIRELAGDGVDELLVVPLGFVSDHMEVVYDLDTQAAGLAEELGVRMVRVPAPGTHPRFVAMLVDLMEEAAGLTEQRPALGSRGPRPDTCTAGCCPAPARPQPAARS